MGGWSRAARPACALVSGAAVAASGPPFDVPGLAWVAFAPLLWAVTGASWLEALALGALAGAVSLAVIGHGVVLYESLVGAGVVGAGALVFGLVALGSRPFLADARAWVRIVGPATVWAAVEWAATLGLSFPGPAAVLVPDSPAVGVARVVGVHGLSFLVLLSSAAVADDVRRGRDGRRFLVAVAPALLALVAGAGLARLVPPPDATVSYRAIQPAIPFDVSSGSWLMPSHRGQLRDRFTAEVRAAAASDAQLVLWPEGAEMLSAFRPEPTRRWLPELFADAKTWLVSSTDLGADGQRRNRVWAFDGEAAPAVYQKRWLVPIAEDAYEPGAAVDGVLATRAARVGPLVCFEACFPSPARRQAAAGADVLFASANDGAFGDTAVPLFHRALVTLRAVETGRTVLFVSNRGPSAEIDARGRIVRELPLGARGVLEGETALHTARTPFVRFGGALHAALLLGLLALALAVRPARDATASAGVLAWSATLAASLAVTLGLTAASLRIVSRDRLSLGSLVPAAADEFPPRVAADALQQASNTCGPSALAFLMSYLGDPVAEAEILRHVTLHPDGTTLRDLRDAARALGYEARGEAGVYANLAATALPAVAHLSDDHYVVVVEAGADDVLLFDPLVGVVRLARAVFERRWSGAVLVVEPASPDHPEDGPTPSLTSSDGNQRGGRT